MKNNDPAASLPPALIDRYRAAYGITAALNDIELAALAKTWEIYESGPTLAALARVEAAVSTKAAAGEPPIHARAKYLRNTAASIQAQSPTYDRFRTTGRRPQTQRRKPHTPPANLRAGETETIDRRRAFVMTYPTAPAPAMAGD